MREPYISKVCERCAEYWPDIAEECGVSDECTHCRWFFRSNYKRRKASSITGDDEEMRSSGNEGVGVDE